MQQQPAASNETLERFLSARDVADLLGISTTTLWRLRKSGAIPEPTQLSPGRVAWSARVVRDFYVSQHSGGSKAKG